MNIDWGQVSGVVSLIGVILGLISTTLGVKYQNAKAATKAFVASVTTLHDEIIAANADGKVTQEEFNQLMSQVTVVDQKAQDSIKAGEDLYNELKAVYTQFMGIVNARTEAAKAAAAATSTGGK